MVVDWGFMPCVGEFYICLRRDILVSVNFDLSIIKLNMLVVSAFGTCGLLFFGGGGWLFMLIMVVHGFSSWPFHCGVVLYGVGWDGCYHV